ncbi:hypothetical protein KDA_70660 [Dictyobacter alpinus]|uniref:Uncharacterized protein n=1 Tax=Dictyobacter alpinus TaxID=2014873 RepID=A0A402BJQ4_9CHLR|nr:hypothetical protein KDA_70660 [Dictyobacter alpinus]
MNKATPLRAVIKLNIPGIKRVSSANKYMQDAIPLKINKNLKLLLLYVVNCGSSGVKVASLK